MLFWLINHDLKLFLMLLGCLKGVCVWFWWSIVVLEFVKCNSRYLMAFSRFLIHVLDSWVWFWSQVFKKSVLDWVLMFLLANNKAIALEVEILYMFLMIQGYLLVFFFTHTYLFMAMWFIGAKRAWFRGVKCIF
jgi:hypothetical protein